MAAFFDRFKGQNSTGILFQAALLLGSVTTVIALLVYAYLGTFTRYLADDYCLSYRLAAGGVLKVSIEKYLQTSNRFANSLLLGASELFGVHGTAYMPAVFIALWVFGLVWLLSQAAKTAGLRWRPLAGFFLAALLAFFTILQADNRYQSLYWRPGLVTYFAPLVFSIYLAGFIFFQVRRAGEGRPEWWAILTCFGVTLLVSGLSETITALQIGILALGLAAVLLWAKGRRRWDALTLLAATLAGASLAMLAMFISPANALRLGTPPPDFATLLGRSFKFAAEFIWNSLVTRPLPGLVSILMPLLIFYGLYSQPAPAQPSPGQKKRIWLIIVLIPLLMYLLIAASFSPSAYGQSYPVERARFPARFVMTAALMLEGVVLGILAAQIRLAMKPALINLLLVLLALSAIYPLRAAWQASALIPEYQARAMLWDERDAQIRAYRSQGVMDIVVQQLPGIDGVKELDSSPGHWVNQCAAAYYGVNAISALPYVPSQ